MSSRENFMVFDANVDEKCTVVKRYIQHTVAELKHLEENVFELNIADEIVKVEYKIAELPNDMKMLCFLGDELSNSAYYFTKFANANHADCSELNKKIGKDSNDWHPFTNEQRKSSGERAAKKATELAKSKLAKSTQRNHFTNFIRDLKSRQEDVPPIDKFIDRAKCEPLHLKNNVVKELFMKILLVVFACSNLKDTKNFIDIKENSLFLFSAPLSRKK